MITKSNSKTENVILNSGVSFCLEQNGENFALGMTGEPETIQGLFNLFFNAGVTNGEMLDCGAANFAYLWTQPERLAWALAKWEIDSLAHNGKLRKTDKLSATRAFYFLNAKWLRWFNGLPRENFVPTGDYSRQAFDFGVESGMSWDSNEKGVMVG